jgi:hypothetical protein
MLQGALFNIAWSQKPSVFLTCSRFLAISDDIMIIQLSLFHLQHILILIRYTSEAYSLANNFFTNVFVSSSSYRISVLPNNCNFLQFLLTCKFYSCLTAVRTIDRMLKVMILVNVIYISY